MGIVTKASVLGNLSGKIGNVILSTWCGLDTIKEVSGERKKGKFSIKLARQNELFKITGKFLTDSSGENLFKKGFQLRKNEHINPTNAATSYHMLNAIAGEYPEYSIDLTKVKFTRVLHSTETGWNAQFVSEEDDLKVQWELNSFAEKTTRLDDEAFVVFYNSTAKRFVTIDGLQRSSLSCTFPPSFKKKMAGHDIFSWLYFISANGKLVSETEYLGMITA